MSVQRVMAEGALESAMEDSLPLLPMATGHRSGPTAETSHTSRKSITVSKMTDNNESNPTNSDLFNSDTTKMEQRTDDESRKSNDTPTYGDESATKDARSLNDEAVNEMTKIKDTSADGGHNILANEDTLSKSKNNMDMALRDAIRVRDVEEVKRLLAEGAPLTYRHNDMTPLHLCIQQYCYWNYEHKVPRTTCKRREMEIFRLVLATALQSDNKSKIIDSLDGKGRSPLYLAIECGYFEVVKALLESDANAERVSKKDETALHVAVQRFDILKYFLENYNIQNTGDVDGYTVIHTAAKFNVVESLKLLLRKFGHEAGKKNTKDGSTVLHVAAEYGSYAVAEYLLRRPYRVYRDNNGETPLNRSAKQGHKSVTALLLSHGAVLSDKGLQGRTAAEQIARRFANPQKFFEDVFDECIIENDSTPMCKERKIHINYKVLANSDGTGMSQIKVVEELVRCGQKEILIHPLIESLLYLKWRCLLPAVYTIMVIYAIFLISLNAFLVTMFYKTDYNVSDYTSSQNETSNFECFDGLSWMWIFFIYLSICLLFGQECIHIYLKGRRYLVHRESWGKLLLLVLSAIVVACVRCSEPSNWLRHFASATLLLSWVQAMLLFSRFPDWGYYVLMLERVTYNIFKILLTSICLIIGFSFCFMIEYHSISPFDGPIPAFVKTLVMMSSEFDYEDLFGEEHDTELQGTKFVVRLLFVIFVIFIAIVLMNFMIGVAVSDINELNTIGNIRRLEKQMELQSTLDGLIDLALQKSLKSNHKDLDPSCNEDPENVVPESFLQKGSMFRKLSRMKFHHNISKDIESDEKWKVWFGISRYYVDDYGQMLSPELQNAIIKVARTKVQRKKNDNEKLEKKNKLNAMYDTLLGVGTSVHPEGEKARCVPPLDFNLNSPDFTLKERISSLEQSNKILIQSIEDLKEKMNLMLECMAQSKTRQINPT